MLEQADEFVKVPMYGFTESLNVSVCAALLMYSVMQRLRRGTVDWRLDAEQRVRVALQWYKHSIKASEEILFPILFLFQHHTHSPSIFKSHTGTLRLAPPQQAVVKIHLPGGSKISNQNCLPVCFGCFTPAQQNKILFLSRRLNMDGE